MDARLRIPLQRTVIQRGIPPRWSQLSQIAWESEISQILIRDKEALSGKTVELADATDGLLDRCSGLHDAPVCLFRNLR